MPMTNACPADEAPCSHDATTPAFFFQPTGDGMRGTAVRAVTEGLKALYSDYSVSAEELGPYPGADGKGISLALHVAITAGKMDLIHVGGVDDRCAPTKTNLRTGGDRIRILRVTYPICIYFRRATCGNKSKLGLTTCILRNLTSMSAHVFYLQPTRGF